MAEESGRPGTWRSKVGCPANDEPCKKRTVPGGFAGSPAHFSKRNSFTPPSLVVQWSSPLIVAAGLLISFIWSRVRSGDWRNMIGLDDVGPFGHLGFHESLELGLRHYDRGSTGLFPGFLDVGTRENLGDLAAELVHDRLGCAGRSHEADPQ